MPLGEADNKRRVLFISVFTRVQCLNHSFFKAVNFIYLIMITNTFYCCGIHEKMFCSAKHFHTELFIDYTFRYPRNSVKMTKTILRQI